MRNLWKAFQLLVGGVVLYAVVWPDRPAERSPARRTDDAARDVQITPVRTPLAANVVAAEKARIFERVGYVVASSLRVRDGPGMSGAIVGLLSRAEEVRVRETRGDWHRVSTRSGKEGWVHGAYISDARPAPPVESAPRMSTRSVDSDAIARRIVARSIDGYAGSCPCPFSRDRAGRRCGARSAYLKPGGAAPICYVDDVTDRMISAFR